ncbi:FecR family protein [Aquimarina mytili]|uniref:FecR family protein n=1 Tax=Aquimarina mytili TaxID=874423 RepID=A0A936ZZR2_9FLAO|nr:FecR family protein [Aquimarina mytili]MBL0684968.1 FecR family protein [Aquimarina mytili]
MDKEYLLKKWLADDLTPSEAKAFEALDDYKAHIKILDDAQFFKASEVSEIVGLEEFYEKINSAPTHSDTTIWYKPLLRVAAIVAIILGVGSFFFFDGDANVGSLASEKISVTLPDESAVVLNAKSNIIYNKRDWNEKREVVLDGEAFFKVTNGSTFDVITNAGKVSVLGTQFNVKNRKGYFEVQCFEGLVNVQYNGDAKNLPAGSTFKVVNGVATSDATSDNEPKWINNISDFKSVPFHEVIQEFERQYDVIFSLENINTSRIFTGGFVHTNIEDGLKSITLPLDLEYKIDSKKHITLYKSKL